MTLKKARTDGKFHEALLDRCRKEDGFYSWGLAFEGMHAMQMSRKVWKEPRHVYN